MDLFKKEIKDCLKKYLKKKGIKEKEIKLEKPPTPSFGDYGLACFELAIKEKKNPAEIAKELKTELEKEKSKWKKIKKVKATGPYVNFVVKKEELANDVLGEIIKKGEQYGQSKKGKGKRIVIDYSHPNIAKPFGVGHLRSTVIGGSLKKLFEFNGYEVIGVNHLGDWGTQFGKLITAYKKWGNKKKLEKEMIGHLLALYVKFHEEADKNEELNEEARGWFKKLEKEDKEATRLWKLFKEMSLKEFKRIYNLLEVDFESWAGESFYSDKIEPTIKKLGGNIKTEISEGALVINLKKYGMPPMMLRKSDGASTYHARDVAAIFYRLKEYNPEKLIYVVGSDHKLHFQQLFKVMELYGIEREKMIHVNFGMIRFAGVKMSTRKGQVVFLEEVLKKAIAMAREIIEEKNPKLKNKEKVAKEVGLGAIIFGDLSHDRIRDIDFDWKKMISFEGETAPYIQYTQARICSILRKAGEKDREDREDREEEWKGEILTKKEEQEIIKDLKEFKEVIERTLEDYKPSYLAKYLLDLSQDFNTFYNQVPVLRAKSEEKRKARLVLIDCTRQVLKTGLNLLGIKAPEQM